MLILTRPRETGKPHPIRRVQTLSSRQRATLPSATRRSDPVGLASSDETFHTNQRSCGLEAVAAGSSTGFAQARVATAAWHGAAAARGGKPAIEKQVFHELPGPTGRRRFGSSSRDDRGVGEARGCYARVRGLGGLIQSDACAGWTARSIACTSSLRTVSRSIASWSRAVKAARVASPS